MSGPSDSYFSKTLEKGLAILSLFDRNHPHISLAAISHKLGINKTSTYRFVNTLVRLGYLKKNPETKQLRLGPRALLMGHNFFQGFELLHSVKPLIDQIFKKERIAIDSALFDGEALLALYRRESADTIFFRQPPRNKDLHARAMGKAVLSGFSREEVLNFIKPIGLKRHTDKTIVNEESLLTELDATRIRGYSLNNEEFIPGLIAIGAPLKNFQLNKVVGAVSFDFSTNNYSIDMIQNEYADAIKKLANDISEIVTTADY